MSDLEFHIEGPGASSVAEELASLLESEFGERPRRSERGGSSGSDEHQEKVDPTALAALAVVLALPGAIKNTLDLAQRLKLKQKLDRLIEWVKQRPEIRITIVSGRGPSIRLDRATPAQIMERNSGVGFQPANSSEQARTERRDDQ